MPATDEDKFEGRMHGPQFDPEEKDGLMIRLIYMVLIGLMITASQTVLVAATVIQFVIMLLSKGEPNEQLADFGTALGIWIAKAVRFQTAASEVKPWPWTELD